jgi:hypothetical protein
MVAMALLLHSFRPKKVAEKRARKRTIDGHSCGEASVRGGPVLVKKTAEKPSEFAERLHNV